MKRVVCIQKDERTSQMLPTTQKNRDVHEIMKKNWRRGAIKARRSIAAQSLTQTLTPNPITLTLKIKVGSEWRKLYMIVFLLQQGPQILHLNQSHPLLMF